MNDTYININKIAEIKGLKSTRSLRMAINNGKYIARTIPVNGGYSYEILYSSLEPEIQEKLEDEEMRSTALVPIVDSKPTFISESARMTSLARADNSGRLLIIDEAENLPYRALEITRRIHDKTGIGVLLVGRNILLENLRGYKNQYDQLYSRVKYHKILDRLHIKDIKKILLAAGQDPELADTFLKFSDGNTRRLEHLISHSIALAKFNGQEKVDDAVISETSKMLMA